MYHVVQKASRSTKNPRGRPPAFDAETVVTGAAGMFWRRGYDATSLTELEAELGVNRSTLYNSFDGKEGLFRAAVEVYLAEVEANLIGPLRDGTQGLDDLVAFTERQRVPLTDPRLPPGYLLANAMVTGDAPEATARYLQSFRGAIEVALARAAELGEVSPRDRSAQASTFLTSVLGTTLAAKSGMSGAELDGLVDGLVATVRSWAAGSAAVGANGK